MNPQLTSELAACQARDLRCAGDRHPIRPEHRERPTANGRHRPSSLRRTMGFTLVEAGLRLLTSTAH